MSKKIKWINKSGGSFRPMIDGKRKIIPPGATFFATEEEVSLSFRDVIQPFNKEDIPDKPVELKGTKSDYKIVTKSKGWFDVVDSTGKVINEKGLRKEKAEELLESLK